MADTGLPSGGGEALTYYLAYFCRNKTDRSKLKKLDGKGKRKDGMVLFVFVYLATNSIIFYVCKEAAICVL